MWPLVRLRRHLSGFILCFLSLIAQAIGVGEVIWAVNSGGEAHTDIHGIRYMKDSLKFGIASDYGKSLGVIHRVVPQDQILYQTERYHTSNFAYEIPIKQDGDYVLVLKFSEVWFTATNQKVFDVVLNNEHTVAESLDIYAKVGRGTAHDEIVQFSVRNGKLKVRGESSKFDGTLKVELMKGERDNPKINALYVMKGSLDDVPKLPPLPGVEKPPPSQETGEEQEEEEEIDEETKKPRKRPRSGPKVQDPYATDDTGSMMLPVIVAVGCFVPLLFCLCKL